MAVHSLARGSRLSPALLLQAASGRQTPTPALGGLLQAGQSGWNSSQRLPGLQLQADEQPVEEMTEQQLEAALREAEWDEAFVVNPAHSQKHICTMPSRSALIGTRRSMAETFY